MVLDVRCVFAVPVTGFVSATPETEGRRVSVRVPVEVVRAGLARKEVDDGSGGGRGAGGGLDMLQELPLMKSIAHGIVSYQGCCRRIA